MHLLSTRSTGLPVIDHGNNIVVLTSFLRAACPQPTRDE